LSDEPFDVEFHGSTTAVTKWSRGAGLRERKNPGRHSIEIVGNRLGGGSLRRQFAHERGRMRWGTGARTDLNFCSSSA